MAVVGMVRHPAAVPDADQGHGAYTIPKIDVQVSATLQSKPARFAKLSAQFDF